MIFLQASEGFSLLDLLADADGIVLTVLIILFLASALSWGVIFEKFFTLPKRVKDSAKFEQDLWSGATGNTGDASNSAAKVFAAASKEWDGLKGSTLSRDQADAMMDRAERAMQATVDREIAAASKWNGFLATVGSASPFIGLLGTVYGILIAFVEIGTRGEANLSAVAGPIAEALFATAMGLVAAIPAVVFYNKFTGDLNRFADQLDAFSKDILVHLSRKASEWIDSGAKGS